MNTKIGFKILFTMLVIALLATSCSSSKSGRGKGCGCESNKGFVGY